MREEIPLVTPELFGGEGNHQFYLYHSGGNKYEGALMQ
jgi:hypothetical protein